MFSGGDEGPVFQGFLGVCPHKFLPSIRLAGVRDGAEDYEWLAMAADIDPAGVADVERTIVKSTTDFTRDPMELGRARSELASIIERARQGLTGTLSFGNIRP